MSILFDDVDDYIKVNSSSDFDFEHTDAFSIGCWVKPNGGSAGQIVAKILKPATFQEGYKIFYSAPSVLRFELRDNISPTQAIIIDYSPSVLTVNTWNHLVATYDGTSVASGARIYVNGEEPGSRSVNTDTMSTNGSIRNNGDLLFGARNSTSVSSTADWFSGEISNVVIWDTKLTGPEASQMYNSRLKDMPWQIQRSNIKGYWPLTDGEDGTSADGDTISDLSGNANNGIGIDGANNTGLTWKAEDLLTYPMPVTEVQFFNNFDFQINQNCPVEILRKFTFLDQNETEDVLSFGQIEKSAEDVPKGSLNVLFSNAGGIWNSIKNDKTSMLSDCKLEFGFETNSNDLLNLFEGRLENTFYTSGADVSLSFIDKKNKNWDIPVGVNSPVDFSSGSNNPADLWWTVVTCFGQLSNSAAPGNPDIDYEAWLTWKSVCANNSFSIQGYFDNNTIGDIVANIGQITDTAFYTKENKIVAKRFNTSNPIADFTDDNNFEIELDITVDNFFNELNVNYSYFPTSKQWFTPVGIVTIIPFDDNFAVSIPNSEFFGIVVDSVSAIDSTAKFGDSSIRLSAESRHTDLPNALYSFAYGSPEAEFGLFSNLNLTQFHGTAEITADTSVHSGGTALKKSRDGYFVQRTDVAANFSRRRPSDPEPITIFNRFKGTVSFWYQPDYTGSPTETQGYIDILNVPENVTAGDPWLRIRHEFQNSIISCFVQGNAGGPNVDNVFQTNTFAAVNGQWYHFEVNYDFTNTSTPTFFIDGGATNFVVSSITGDENDQGPQNIFYFGAGQVNGDVRVSSGSAFFINDLRVSPNFTHTGSFAVPTLAERIPQSFGGINYATNINLSNETTISFWHRSTWTSTPHYDVKLFDFSNNSNNESRIKASINSGTGNLQIIVHDNLGTEFISATYSRTTINSGTWYHIETGWDFTIENSMFYIAVDGDMVQFAANSAAWPDLINLPRNFYVGKWFDEAGNGDYIDELQIWDKILHTNSFTSPTTALVRTFNRHTAVSTPSVNSFGTFEKAFDNTIVWHENSISATNFVNSLIGQTDTPLEIVKFKPSLKGLEIFPNDLVTLSNSLLGYDEANVKVTETSFSLDDLSIQLTGIVLE